MKKFGLILILAFTTFFSSCEKDLYEEAIINSNKTSVQTISFDKLPINVTNEVKAIKEKRKKSGVKYRGIEEFILNEDKIIEIIKEDGYISYNFIIEKTLNDSIPFSQENLNILIKDNKYTAIVTKYIPTDGKVFDNINNFTGEIKYYDLDDNLKCSIDVVGGLFTQLRQEAVTFGCYSYVLLILGDSVTVLSVTDICEGVGGGPGGEPNNNFGEYYDNPNSYGSTVSTILINDPSLIQHSGITVTPNFLDDEEVVLENYNNFFNTNLNQSQRDFLNSNQLINIEVFNYLASNGFNGSNKTFAKDLINLSISEVNQTDVTKLVKIAFILKTNEENLFSDAFETSIDPYVDIDLVNNPPDLTPNLFGIKIYLNYKKLRQINPEWSKTKCLWEASKDIIHLSLDAFGLIPVAGEIADLANGALYTIEGDGLNATLSYASAVPVVGWASAGTKFGLKVINVANDVNSKVKLVWKVLPNNVIYFGADNTCRAQLRKILGLAVGNPLIAHHIMPISLQTNEIIQKAAKSSSAFHLNEALNGIALNSLQHTGNHANYTTEIFSKLQEFKSLNPNATPLQCYSYVTSLINQIKAWVIAHPNTNINLIVLN